jgi:hypothetical protein
MISWGAIVYGAAISSVLAVAFVWLVLRERAAATLAAIVSSAFGAPVAWNAILRATHAREFFTDAPIAVLPASWQDTGSGVFTFAVTVAVLGLVRRQEQTGRTVALAGGAALVAFLVDVYLY